MSAEIEKTDVDDISTAETLRLIGRSLVFVLPYWKQLTVKLMLSLFGVVIVLILPWPLKILTDHVVMGLPVGSAPTPYPPYAQPLLDMMIGLTPIETVWNIVAMSLAGILLIGAFGTGAASDRADGSLAEGLDTATKSENQANVSDSRISGLLGLFEYRYQLRTTHGINHDLRSLLYNRLMSLPMMRFSDVSIGDTLYRVMYDTPSISRVCYDIYVTPIVSIFTLVIVIWTTEYSFSAVPSLVATAWLAAPLMLFGSLIMTRITRQRSIAARKAGATTTATVEEGMSNIAAVQSLGAGNKQRASFASDSDQSFRRFRLFELMNLLMGGLQATVIISLVFYVFFDVANAIIDGRMSAGDYAVLYAFFFQITLTAGGLGAMWFNLQNSVAGMKRVFDIIDMPVDADHHGEEVLTQRASGIQLENVSFSYSDGSRALSSVNLEAHIGEMIALVGATGAGKTTLAYTLPGFVIPSSGRVLIDNTDLADLSVSSIRESVAFVFQEPVVFDDTAANNIRMGNPDATQDEIVTAARTAGATSFIEDLPNGFDTRLGQAGATLSVGQKQRLAIARGLVSRSPILILDEPTAALDPETENALVKALQTERGQRLLIVIAHRLSTIRSADRIVFIDRGKILETGSHDELMARRGGAYRRFVDLQIGATA